MQDIGIIPEGAVLIRGGVIEDIGPTRRVANLVRAKRAKEIDATGHVVMPAFVDPDVPLVTHALSTGQRAHAEKSSLGTEPLRLMSRRRMVMRAETMAHGLASYGVLTAGASTISAEDPRNALRVLRAHKEIQSLPVRVCSVLSSLFSDPPANRDSPNRGAGWLEQIRGRGLACIVEFELSGTGLSGTDQGAIRQAAQAAVQHGFAVRFQTGGAPDRVAIELALTCGAIAVHGSRSPAGSVAAALAQAGCLFVARCAGLIDADPGALSGLRAAIDSGAPVAISSGFRSGVPSSFNMQFNLQLAASRMNLTPEEAITAATHNAAAALRISDSAGSLAPGRPADLLMLDVPDFRELLLRAGHHDVLMVMRAGKVIYRRPALMLD